MKTFVKILIGIVVGIVLLISLVFFLTAGLAGAANEFFAHVRAGEHEEAYGLLSKGFQETMDREQFRAFLEEQGLTDVTETTWNSRETTGNMGGLEGTVTTGSGRAIPLKIKFIKDASDWKIQFIGAQKAGAVATESAGGGSALTPPSEAEQIALVEESMTEFARAVNAKDFTSFHGYIAEAWRREVAVEKLNEVFKGFIDREINLLPAIESLQPAFDGAPVVNEDGILNIKGLYPSNPNKVHFDLGYHPVGTSWKLIQINVNIR